jgi:peptidoglycan/LPS O-acetylase OafA/YrhL
VKESAAKGRLNYRPEIDGLRAIAVIGVLIYHADISIGDHRVLPGGFLGVDVFFVISGYLITAILLRSIGDGSFSFGAFYERRARRILPALLAVMLCTIPLAWRYLLPGPFIEYAQSLLATSAFSANFFFWTLDPYTSEPSAFKPLLHTWSLAVEEQFYLVYPALLCLLCLNRRKWLAVTLLLLAGSSLLLAAWTGANYPSANFYGLPTRFWELLVGSLLASWEHERPGLTGRAGGGWLRLLGLVMICVSYQWLQDDQGLPSWPSLVPVLGTALLLAAPGGPDRISRLLSAPVLVGIGLVSYSLYLWHQPIFAFSRLALPGEISLANKLLLLLLCGGLAFLSYRYVETPFRDASRTPPRLLWTSVGGCLVLLLAIGTAGWLSNGFPSRLPPVLQKLTVEEMFRGMLIQDGRTCHARAVTDACVFPGETDSPRWLLVGDSNAYGLALPLKERLAKRGLSFTSLTDDGCYYAPGLEGINAGEVQCPAATNLARRRFLLEHSPAVVVVAGSLAAYYLGGFRQQELPPVALQTRPPARDEEQRRKAVSHAITSGLRELLATGHKLVIVYPVPEHATPVPQVLANALRSDRQALDSLLASHSISTSYSGFIQRTEPVYRLLDSLGESPSLLRVYPEATFCRTGDGERCAAHDDQDFFYRDAFHLSAAGASLLADRIMKAADGYWQD